MGLLSFPWGRRAPTQYDAALLPATGDVVVASSDLGDERVPAAKARAIAEAVRRHDAAVKAGIIQPDLVTDRTNITS